MVSDIAKAALGLTILAGKATVGAAYGAAVLGRGALRVGQAWRLSQAMVAEKLPCLRGHENAVYGTFACQACSARWDGYAFAACPACGIEASWFACDDPACAQPVLDPRARAGWR